MDWFEQATGLRPDGGNGAFETAIVVSVVILVLVALSRFLVNRRARRIRN
jgi:hypothetical protein